METKQKKETAYGKAKRYFYGLKREESVNIAADAEARLIRQSMYAIQRAYNKRYAAEGAGRLFKCIIDKKTQYMKIWRII